MVKGLEKFIEYFKGFDKYYRIIGGTACDVYISESGFRPRATNDIDLLIVIEEYDEKFNNALWNFITAAGYRSLQKEAAEQKFYRFSLPDKSEYPVQLELLCRNSGIIQVPSSHTVIPLPENEDLSHLSAIILDDNYYKFTLDNSHLINGIHIAGINALICLKAYAYLNMRKQEGKGIKIRRREIDKHWRDVMRLTALLSDNDVFVLPDSIKADLSEFVRMLKEKKPDVGSFMKSMGIPKITLQELLQQLEASFLTNK